VSFFTGTQAELLYTLPAAVTKNTYTTQAILSAPAATANICKIPGGYFSGSDPNPIGRPLYLRAFGSIATTSAATFSPAIALNTTAGTILGTWNTTIYTAVAPTASVTAQWDLELWFTCQQSGDLAGLTLQMNGKWSQSSVASGGALTAPATSGWDSAVVAANLTGLTPATTYFIELLGTWSASASGNTTTLQQMFLFGLN
jgi:hypothetical protein